MEFFCDCGQLFKAEEDWSGKRASCNSCGKVIEIPYRLEVVRTLDIPESESAPGTELEATVEVVEQVAERVAEEVLEEEVIEEGIEVVGTVETPRVAIATPVQPLGPTSQDHRMRNDLARFNRRTKSQAGNPGKLRVDYFRYALAFPKWVLIWHASVVPPLLLALLVHGYFRWLVFVMAGICVWYWSLVRAKFIGGCVNAGIVLSIDPPMVAVLTSVTQGRTLEDWTCVKILEQPLDRMSSGAVSVLQPVATVSVYQSMYSTRTHWDNFFPTVVDIVTANQVQITRIMMSMDPSDWSELKNALRQLPQPFHPGLFRIYSKESFATVAVVPHVAGFIEALMREISKNDARFQNAAKRHNVQQVMLKIGVAPEKPVLAYIHGAGDGDGLILTVDSVHYHFGETGAGMFRWSDVVGAFAVEGCFEITLRSGKRVRIPERHILEATTSTALETAFNQIAGNLGAAS